MDETWTKRASIGGADLYCVVDGEAPPYRIIADCILEEDADRIIADHAAARELEDARAALTDARSALGTGRCTVPDCIGCKADAEFARDAIADYFAKYPDAGGGA